jgi:MYXO-CTERM domain-containing protein
VAEICCKGPNGLEQTTAEACADLGGDALDLSWCAEPICCARDDLFNSEPAIQCELNGGIEVAAENCAAHVEEICCRIPNAAPMTLTAEACDAVDGLPADPAHCAADPDAPGEERVDASARPIAHPDATNTTNDDGCSTAPNSPSGAWWLLALPLLLRRRRR